MKRYQLLLFALAMPSINAQQPSARIQTSSAPAHVSNSFQFVVQEPLRRAATLFGPEAERCWAGEQWKPEFLHPQPGEDVQGAVFTVAHGSHKSVWVNTIFDLTGGRMQYVAFLPDTVVFTVDVKLTALNASATSVGVTYVRTALNEMVNGNVEAMGKRDRESGPEWQREIESCLTMQHKDTR
jgi:hypothetical protein